MAIGSIRKAVSRVSSSPSKSSSSSSKSFSSAAKSAVSKVSGAKTTATGGVTTKATIAPPRTSTSKSSSPISRALSAVGVSTTSPQTGTQEKAQQVVTGFQQPLVTRQTQATSQAQLGLDRYKQPEIADFTSEDLQKPIASLMATDTFNKQLDQAQKDLGMTIDRSQFGLAQAIDTAVKGGQTNLTEAIKAWASGKEVAPPPTPKFDQAQFADMQGLADAAVAGGLSQEQADEAMQALDRGVPLEPIKDYFDKWAKKKEEFADTPEAPQATGIDLAAPPPVSPSQGLSMPPQEIEIPVNEKIATATEGISKLDSSSIMSTLTNLNIDPSTMTSAEATQLMLLQMGLSQADNPAGKNFLERSYAETLSAYNQADLAYGNDIAQISAAIDGEDFIPTSFAGVAAKAYTQAKESGLDSIELESEYKQAQYDAWMSEERDKRSRLEGYLKAKLYAAGAQDSSAGLTTMAIQINAADLRLQMAQAEHNYAMGALNIQARDIMNNFANNVVQLGLQAQSDRDSLQSTLAEKLTTIEGQMIENEKEKDKMRIEAISTFNDKMQIIDKEKKAQEEVEYQRSYQKIKDATDTAYKMSGLLGEVYVADPTTGEIINTKVPTFDAKKWEHTEAVDFLTQQRNLENDAWDKAELLLDGGQLEQAAMMLGLSADYFAGYATIEQQKLELDAAQWSATYDFDQAKFAFDQLKWQTEYNSTQVPLATPTVPGSIAGGLETLFPPGYYSSNQYGDLQCGEFMHKLLNIPSMGNSLDSKVGALSNVEAGYMPKVGDLLITNEHPKYGHIMMINNIDYEKGIATITEANYQGAGVVSHNRKMALNDPRIKGIHNTSESEFTPQVQSFVKASSAPPVKMYNEKQRTAVIEMQKSLLREQEYTDLKVVNSSFSAVQAGMDLQSSFGDLTMINSFQKMIDPGAVVRPSEFDSVAQAQGFLQDKLNLPAKVIEGDKLTAEGRQSLYDAAAQIMQTRKSAFESEVLPRYEQQAATYGIEYDDFGDRFINIGGENVDKNAQVLADYEEWKRRGSINSGNTTVNMAPEENYTKDDFLAYHKALIDPAGFVFKR